MQKKSYWKMTALCLIVILVMGIVSALVKTQAGNILIREVKVSTRGGSLSGMIYVPKEALENDGKGNYTNKRPVVILSHGYLNSNEMQDPNAIELSRRGYIVFSMDMYGHGKLLISMNVVMILLTLLYVSYTVISSRETMRAYYFLSLLFGIAAAVQILKTGAAVLMCGKKSDEK